MKGTSVTVSSFVLGAVILIIQMGCTSSQTPQTPAPFLVEFSADTLPSYNLEGELFISSDSLGMPNEIAVGEDFVFIGDPYASQAITVFDKESGDFVAHTATKGDGAREISYLGSMNFRSGTNSGWLYAYPGTAKYFDGESITDNIIRLTGEGTPMDPVWVIGDSIISSGFYESGRLGVYAPSGEFIRTIGALIPGETSISVMARQYAYQAILKANSAGTRIVAGSLNTDRVEIFNTSEMLHLIRGPGFHEPEFSILDFNGSPRTFIEDETIQGYISIAVTDQLIFALYSGSTRGWVRSQGYFSPPSQTVIVFTWNGSPVGVLGLQDGAVEIGVTQDGQYIYAVYRNPEPIVIRYDVPNLM